MDCSTIIVSYNTFALTSEAIRSALSAAEGLAHEVIVVDNNSPDDSAVRLREAFPKARFPQVTVFANTDNPGFSAANNQGAAHAKGRILFFLNPDTVVHGQAIRILCDFLDGHPEAGAVGPHVLNTDGTDQPSSFPFLTARYLLWHHLPVDALLSKGHRRPDQIPAATSPVDIIKGCALAIKRQVFHEIGQWDTSYFMYAEETELCLALHAKGYTNYFVREAQITHHGGVSSWSYYAEQQIVHQRSMLQYIKRHHGLSLLLLNRLTGTLGFGARALLFPLLARMNPSASDDYARRGKAAHTLFHWFLREYA